MEKSTLNLVLFYDKERKFAKGARDSMIQNPTTTCRVDERAEAVKGIGSEGAKEGVHLTERPPTPEFQPVVIRSDHPISAPDPPIWSGSATANASSSIPTEIRELPKQTHSSASPLHIQRLLNTPPNVSSAFGVEKINRSVFSIPSSLSSVSEHRFEESNQPQFVESRRSSLPEKRKSTIAKIGSS